jgi:hypothetical protein
MAESQDPDLVAPPPPKAPANVSVPVWDPDTGSLRAVDAAHAKQLEAEGYAVGTAAQHEAEQNSPSTELKGFVGTAANAATAGLTDLGLAYTGHQDAVRGLDEYRERHPYQAGAANFLGFGASLVAGPASYGLGLLGKVAGRSLATRVAAHAVVPGAAAAAVQGAAEELTREKLVNDPVHLDQIASSAFSQIVWNSVANTLGYSVGKLPHFIRAKSGNWLDWAEREGWHVPQLKKDAAVPAQGPQLSRATVSTESSFEKQVGSQEFNRSETIDDLRDRLQTEQFSQATIKHAEASAEENATKQSTTVKTGKSVSQRAAAQAPSAVPASAKPDEVKPVFEWPAGYKKSDKTGVLTRMMKNALGKDETNLQFWNESTRLAKEIGKYQKAVASGEFDAAATAPVIDKLVREKEEIKNYLYEAIPGQVTEGKFTPGFRDLDEEYARVSGNRYHDLADPSFGPAVPKAKVATPTVRTNEQFSESKASADKLKKSASDATTAVEKDRTKTDVSVRDYDKEVAETRASEKDIQRGKQKFTATFTFPKKPPTYTQVGIKQPFANQDIAQTLIAGSFVPGLGAPSKAAAAYMGGRNTLAWLASRRQGIGEVVGRAGDRFLKYGTPTIQATVKTFGERAHMRPYAGVPAVSVDSYLPAADVLNAAATNPQAIQQHFEQQYPQFHAAYPQAAAQVSASVMRAARLLNETVPKRPYAPTLRDTQFRPPRAQQVRMLSRWQILSNPQMALRTGDPQTLQLLKEAYPAWYEHTAKRLVQDARDFKGPVSGQVARNITAFTGAAVNPINNAAAQKRMQATAGPLQEPASGQQGGGAPKIGNGPQSTKTANAAANRDDPSFELN